MELWSTTVGGVVPKLGECWRILGGVNFKYHCLQYKCRGATRGDLAVPRSTTTRYGQRCFAVSGPTLWNSLPLSARDPSLTLTQFCTRLKTVLFCRAYETLTYSGYVTVCCPNINSLTYLLTYLNANLPEAAKFQNYIFAPPNAAPVQCRPGRMSPSPPSRCHCLSRAHERYILTDRRQTDLQ